MLHTYDLFITRIVHGKLPISVELHKKIKLFVDNNYSEENKLSSINAFQFHNDFVGKKELIEILNNYFRNFLQIEICYSWLNVLGNNSYNFPHTHSGAGVTHAGVFYLSPENNNLHFAKDDNHFEIKPTLYDFLIFPSHLIHYVLPENRVEKRICFSFNLNKI
jgi:hypothetical protein